MKRYGKYGIEKKVEMSEKDMDKYRRKVSWIVKRYGK